MPGWLKFSCGLGLSLWLSACQPTSEPAVTIKSLSAARAEGQVRISARLDFKLPRQPRQALMSGIPLTWQATVKADWPENWRSHCLSRPLACVKALVWSGRFAFSETLTESLDIEYRALTGRYWVHFGERAENFASLSEALASLSKLDLALSVEHSFWPQVLALKIDFRYEQLPLPLRPFAYFDSQWALSMPWQSCPVPE